MRSRNEVGSVVKHCTGAAEARGARKWLIVSALIAAFAVFTAVVFVVTLTLRERLRAQLLSREAGVLHPVTLFEIQRERSALHGIYLEDDLLGSLLEVANLDGVVAMRIFDANGEFLDAAPNSFLLGTLAPEDFERLQSLKPVSHFHPSARLSNYFYDAAGGTETAGELPLLEVLVPIHNPQSPTLLGIAQYMLNGQPLQADFAELDRNLMHQAGVALLTGLVIGGGLIGLAFSRLQKSNRLLLERSRALARANNELVRSARTSAIGTVTAHLLHGLKNPLSALQLYVEERREQAEDGRDDGLADAGEATRRMQRMIQETVTVLRQSDDGEDFELTGAELCEIAAADSQALARERRVQIQTQCDCDAQFDRKRANLLILALRNLLQNAIEASPAGSTVIIECSNQQGVGSEDEATELRVVDQGSGLPERMRGNPFAPVKSSKAGGSGIGLAITEELVRHMGGKIRVETSDERGTTFAIRLS